LGQPTHLTQKHDDRFMQAIVQQGDLVFIPAEQPSYLQLQANNSPLSILNIYLQPELVSQIASGSAESVLIYNISKHTARVI
jgi:cupin superfamily acireductone dioxygenase involved in methionine salvage